MRKKGIFCSICIQTKKHIGLFTLFLNHKTFPNFDGAKINLTVASLTYPV